MPKFLTKEAITQVQDLPFKDIEVPEWEGTVRVVGLDGEKVQQYVSGLVVVDEDGKVRQLNTSTLMIDLLSLSLTNEKFEPLFPGDDGKKILGKKSAAVLARLFDEAQKLSGIGKQAEAQALKNSEGMSDAVSRTA